MSTESVQKFDLLCSPLKRQYFSGLPAWPGPLLSQVMAPRPPPTHLSFIRAEGIAAPQRHSAQRIWEDVRGLLTGTGPGLGDLGAGSRNNGFALDQVLSMAGQILWLVSTQQSRAEGVKRFVTLVRKGSVWPPWCGQWSPFCPCRAICRCLLCHVLSEPGQLQGTARGRTGPRFMSQVRGCQWPASPPAGLSSHLCAEELHVEPQGSLRPRLGKHTVLAGHSNGSESHRELTTAHRFSTFS